MNLTLHAKVTASWIKVFSLINFLGKNLHSGDCATLGFKSEVMILLRDHTGHEWVGLKNRGIAYILDRKTNLLHNNNVKIEINT